MSISDQDWELMRQVADYYEATRKEIDPEAKYKPKREDTRSIRETAGHFHLTRTKVTKILVTMGLYDSPMVREVQRLRGEGKSVKQIAEELSVAVGTVSSYLPYEDEIHGSENPSEHAAAMREYRAYEKARAERQVQRRAEAEKRSAGQAQTEDVQTEDRQTEDTQTEDTKKGEKQMVDTSWKDEWKKEVKLSYTETDTRPVRLTLEEEEEELKQYISMHPEVVEQAEELYREYEKDYQEYLALKDKAERDEEEQKRLAELERSCGVFPGALADRNLEELQKISGEKIPSAPRTVIHLHLELQGDGGAFLFYSEREKYERISRDVVVPYDMPLYAIHFMIQRLFGWENSHLHEFELKLDDMKRLTGDRLEMWKKLVGIVFRSPLMWDDEDRFWADDYRSGSFKNWLTKKYTGPYMSQCHGEGILSCMRDMKDWDGEKEYYCQTVLDYDRTERVVDIIPVIGNEPPEKSTRGFGGEKLQTLKFGDCPIDALRLLYELNALELLERLPIATLLKLSDEDGKCYTAEEIVKDVEESVSEILESGVDSPDFQVMPSPVSEELYYHYDFGDNWCVKITGTRNCEELVKKGIVTQEQLDRANIKCRELYRPVTIAVEGDMLVDDVGGTTGLADFLSTVTCDLRKVEKEWREEVKEEKKRLLAWAKGLGWRRYSPWI